MTEAEKVQADSIVIVLHRKDSHWSGELLINGDSASGCNAGSAEAVLDSLWSGAFQDGVGNDAMYTTSLESEHD